MTNVTKITTINLLITTRFSYCASSPEEVHHPFSAEAPKHPSHPGLGPVTILWIRFQTNLSIEMLISDVGFGEFSGQVA